MTLQAIVAQRPEVGKMVYDKYPVTKKEMGCLVEKVARDGLRWAMAKRLINEQKEKKEYQ